MRKDKGQRWEEVTTCVIGEDAIADGDEEHTHGGDDTRPVLIVVSGGLQGQRYILDKALLMGRGPDADIQLHAADISRHHAIVRSRSKGKWVLQDLNSRNGCRVNDEAVKERLLHAGDRIALGAATVLLYSERTSLEEKLLSAQHQESLGRLAGGIAHDFNNLLASMLADIRYLREGAEGGTLNPDELIDCVATMETAATRCVELTNQLMGFARQGKYESCAVDIGELLDDVEELLCTAIGQGIEVRKQVQAGLSVRGDPTQLRQVLVNLLLNAKDAMPTGGTIVVSATLKDSAVGATRRDPTANVGPATVVLRVQDNGTGMNANVLERAFDPFFTTKPVGAGSGLGLAAVRGIVQNHGGKVWLESRPSHGTTCTVELPAVEALKDGFAYEGTTTAAPAVGGSAIVADDDQNQRKDLARMVRELGYEPLEVADGQEALVCFAEHRNAVRLVVLDVMMPRLKGTEALKLLRDQDPHLRAILVSGYIDPARMNGTVEGEGTVFLRKPVNSKSMRQAITRLRVAAG